MTQKTTATAFPLQWPLGWPRTPMHNRQDSRRRFARSELHSAGYKSHTAEWTFEDARMKMLEELQRLGASNVVLSSNYELRNDGWPYARQRQPDDTGIAVYFELKGKQLVMACDMHTRAQENMRSITLSISAMRQLDRHGGGKMMERAFEGFAALPAPGRIHWTHVLKLPADATRDQIEQRYKTLAAERHPDSGGSHDMMADLNRARADALRDLSEAA